jgi:hypothetical protein
MEQTAGRTIAGLSQCVCACALFDHSHRTGNVQQKKDERVDKSRREQTRAHKSRQEQTTTDKSKTEMAPLPD